MELRVSRFARAAAAAACVSPLVCEKAPPPALSLFLSLASLLRLLAPPCMRIKGGDLTVSKKGEGERRRPFLHTWEGGFSLSKRFSLAWVRE